MSIWLRRPPAWRSDRETDPANFLPFCGNTISGCLRTRVMPGSLVCSVPASDACSERSLYRWFPLRTGAISSSESRRQRRSMAAAPLGSYLHVTHMLLVPHAMRQNLQIRLVRSNLFDPFDAKMWVIFYSHLLFCPILVLDSSSPVLHRASRTRRGAFQSRFFPGRHPLPCCAPCHPTNKIFTKFLLVPPFFFFLSPHPSQPFVNSPSILTPFLILIRKLET